MTGDFPPPPLPPPPDGRDPVVARCDRALRELGQGRSMVPAGEVVDLLLDLRALAVEKTGRA